ncbi:MAG: hypothetical protein FWJ65_10450, partial [Limnochordales bacterium]
LAARLLDKDRAGQATGAGLAHLEDDLLVGTTAVTIAADGYAWALRSTSGGIAVDRAGAVYAPGVKRPQATHEQRNPQDVVFVHGDGIAPEFAARLPLQPSGAEFSGRLALGGDGTLYLTRRQRVLIGGAPEEKFVLWQVPVGRAGLAAQGRVID